MFEMPGEVKMQMNFSLEFNGMRSTIFRETIYCLKIKLQMQNYIPFS